MANRQRVLLVDDEQDFANGLARLIARLFPDVHVDVAFSGQDALEHIRKQRVHVMVTDLRMPGMGGMELLRRVMETEPDVSVVVLTAHGTIETAVEALQAGAYDFVTKPVEPEQVARVLRKGLERARLLDENRRLRDLVALVGESGELVGESPTMQSVRRTVATVAPSDYTVLIRGESGTGKEMVARMVHRLSPRVDEPFLALNCPAIPEHLLESELFGHVRGAFTGAERDRKGLFSIADGGTVLLDEIGDISSNIQTKLLRFLQEGEVRPVGSPRNEHVDVRIIASTNQDLEARMASRDFREDLFYRLNVVTIWVPPLRERLSDIPLLAATFLARASRELGVPQRDFDEGVLDHLMRREWPGNVRELQNYVRRLALFSRGDGITLDAVQQAEQSESGAPAALCVPSPVAEGEVMPYKDAKASLVESFSERYLRDLLESTGGNVTEAARLSGLSRVSIQKMVARYGIDAAAMRANGS